MLAVGIEGEEKMGRLHVIYLYEKPIDLEKINKKPMKCDPVYEE